MSDLLFELYTFEIKKHKKKRDFSANEKRNKK